MPKISSGSSTLRPVFSNLEVFNLHAIAAHAPGHAHTFEYARGIRSCTDGARSTLAVVLTVCSVVYTGKTMPLDNALEATVKNFFHAHLVSDGFLYGVKIAKLYDLALRRSACLFEVPHHGLGSVLRFGFIKSQLESRISILLFSKALSNHASTTVQAMF